MLMNFRKMRLSTLIFTILLSNLSFAQNKINREEIIGFACYEGGSSSAIVNDITFDIDSGNFKKVIRKLNSKISAERFMAVIVSERLSELNKYELSDREKDLIKEAYESEDFVSVCSGCSYFDSNPLKSLLLKEKGNIIRTEAQYWLDDHLAN